MYRYNDAAKDARSLTQFALHKFKDQRGHRVKFKKKTLKNWKMTNIVSPTGPRPTDSTRDALRAR
jgi:hypothetical protein